MLRPSASLTPASNPRGTIQPISVAAYVALKNYKAKPAWSNWPWPPPSSPCWYGGNCQIPHPSFPPCILWDGCPPGSTDGNNPTVNRPDGNITVMLNTATPRAFAGTVYAIVPYDPATPDHIPPGLEPIFGPKGWICTSKAARQDLLRNSFASPNPSPWFRTQHCGAGT